VVRELVALRLREELIFNGRNSLFVSISNYFEICAVSLDFELDVIDAESFFCKVLDFGNSGQVGRGAHINKAEEVAWIISIILYLSH
jgi:hypothetical protein